MIIETCSEPDCSDCTGRWWTGDVGTAIHVVPVGDVAAHHTLGCSCNPVREMQVHTCDGVGHMEWLVIHNAFDGREATDG